MRRGGADAPWWRSAVVYQIYPRSFLDSEGDGIGDLAGITSKLDYVPNHTSREHPWFLESRSARESPKRDWYVWRDGHNGGPPNNWVSAFGGPAWTHDAETGQWYLHLFLSQQPDLNWANPEVVEAMQGVLRFWLDRGVDGFRADVVHLIGKDEALPNRPEEIAHLDIVG